MLKPQKAGSWPCGLAHVMDLVNLADLAAKQPSSRKPCPTDGSDEEWAFVAPYLVLVREDALAPSPLGRGLQRHALNRTCWSPVAAVAEQIPP